MSRFNRFITLTQPLVNLLRPQLSLDLGSTQTKVMLNRALVWQQPTLLAWHAGQRMVVAVGQQAARLRGKIPSQIQLIHPVQAGIIAELDFTQWYLEAIKLSLRQKKLIHPWSLINCQVAVPAAAAPIEKLQLRQVLRRAGWGQPRIVAKAAAWAKLRAMKNITPAHGVIDWGGETVEVAILSADHILAGMTFKAMGSDDLTKLIRVRTLAEYDLKIGWESAEQIKHQLTNLLTKESKTEQKITVRGQHARSQQVVAVRIEMASFQTELRQLTDRLLARIKQFMAALPLGVTTALQEQGFYLTGGGSQLAGWASLVQQELALPTMMAKKPTLELVKGLAHDGQA